MKTRIADIILIGTELVHGQVSDELGPFIARSLFELGIEIGGFHILPDREKDIRTSIQFSLLNKDIVIITGGLGPTADDLTRSVLADITASRLIEVKSEVERIEEFFNKRNRYMPDNNLKQAMFPEGAEIIPNATGTAAGIFIEQNNKMIFALPGVPSECRQMFLDNVLEILKKKIESIPPFKYKHYKFINVSESQVDEIVTKVLGEYPENRYQIRAKPEEIQVTIGIPYRTYDSSVAVIEKGLRHLLKDNLFAANDESMEQIVSYLLTVHKKTLAVAESCTGGFIGHTLTNIPDASKFLLADYVVYSNEAKVNVLGVSPHLLDEKGAVSSEVAKVMALKAREKIKADIGLSVTGIAGPGGGSDQKPVGLVYIAISDKIKTECFKNQFYGARVNIKMKTMMTALDILRRKLLL